MLSTLLRLCGVAMTAAVLENAVFTRALGDGALPYNRFRPRQAVAQGLLMTAVSVAAALAGWLGEELISNYYAMPGHLRPPVYLMVFSVFYAVLYLLMTKVPALAPLRQRAELHPAVVFGYIPVATMLFIGYGTYTLGEALAYGFGVGAGYLAAMLLTYLLRERTWFSRVPRAFRGLPVALMYTGLVSLALFGLLGHQPPI